METWSVVERRGKGKKNGRSNNTASRTVALYETCNAKDTSGRATLNSSILLHDTGDEGYSEKKANEILKDAADIMKVFESSLFFKRITDYINSSIDNNSHTNSPLSHMVSLGIGKFSESRPALLQLSLAACIGKFYKLSRRNINSTDEDVNSDNSTITASIPRCEIFDPLFGQLERKVASSLGFEVCDSNQKGKHNVNSSSGRTLFFMPHCPYRLYCNVLWSNWKQLDSLIILGNSFQNYHTRRVGGAVGSGDLVLRLNGAFSETAIDTSLLCTEDAERLQQASDAFSDLSLHRTVVGATVKGLNLSDVLIPGEDEMDLLCMQDGEVRV